MIETNSNGLFKNCIDQENIITLKSKFAFIYHLMIAINSNRSESKLAMVRIT